MGGKTREVILKKRISLLLTLLAGTGILLGCARLIPYESPLVLGDPEAFAAPRPNAERFGFFAEEFYQNFAEQLDSRISLFGARPAYVLWFQQIDDAFPLKTVRHNANLDIKTVISMNVKSLSFDARRNDTLLREITLGAWDSTLAAFARAAASVETTVFLRFGYEMNGSWFPWGRKPRDFVAAWNHAHALFRENGASNVRWIFAPNVACGDADPWRDILPYYPGDSTVDAVGLDGYNFGDDHGKWHRWQSFRHVFEPSLRMVYALGKPLWITETACPSDPRRPAWLDELFTIMKDNPCIEAVIWFDAHKTDEPDFRLASDNASLTMMRQWLAR